jgi:hypothetical protein
MLDNTFSYHGLFTNGYMIRWVCTSQLELALNGCSVPFVQLLHIHLQETDHLVHPGKMSQFGLALSQAGELSPSDILPNFRAFLGWTNNLSILGLIVTVDAQSQWAKRSVDVPCGSECH